MFLILDGLRVHHSKPVKAWLADRTDFKLKTRIYNGIHHPGLLDECHKLRQQAFAYTESWAVDAPER